MNFHAAPHPHYLLQSIDNRYRALIDEMEHSHARTIAELKEGYNSILRLQETLIFEQAKHIARLENQLRPPAQAQQRQQQPSDDEPSTAAYDPDRLAPPPPPVVPPKSQKRHSFAEAASAGGSAEAESARPRSTRLDSFSTVLSGETGFYSDVPEPTPAEMELQRAAREQIAAWKRQVGGGGSSVASASAAPTQEEEEEEDEEDEEDERTTIRARSRGEQQLPQLSPQPRTQSQSQNQHQQQQQQQQQPRRETAPCESPVSTVSFGSKVARSARRSKKGLEMLRRLWERGVGRIRTA